MAFQFYIDGYLTDQPVNDTELNSSIVRDEIANNLTITQDATIKWMGNNNLEVGQISGFAYLNSLLLDGICNEAELKIYNVVNATLTHLHYVGVIKIPSIEIDLQRMILSTKVQDNSFYSYIKNNGAVKVKFDALKTKSNLTATPLGYYKMTHLPSLYEFKVYEIVEVMEQIIFCITDGKVSFQSTYLSNLEFPLFICKGQNLINPISHFPAAQGEMEMSFNDAFSELEKLYNWCGLSNYIPSRCRCGT